MTAGPDARQGESALPPRAQRERDGRLNRREFNEEFGELRPGPRRWQKRIFHVIFGHHTRAGAAFDLALLVMILVSTVAVMLETVDTIDEKYHRPLIALEWLATIAFTIEYVLRIICLRNPRKYIFSFFGLVDLLSIVPTYASLFFEGSRGLATVRALRLLRIFRILKLARFIREGRALRRAVWESRAKLVVFLLGVAIVVTIIGSAMYLVEGPSNPEQFGNIPQCIYWAIITLATVGYGDAYPITPVGKILTSILVIFGYSLIVVPTGIVSAELSRVSGKHAVRCQGCGRGQHDDDASFCKWCGETLQRGPDVAASPDHREPV